MPPIDVRWLQRFSNYKKALEKLSRFIEKGALNEFEEQGLIQCFEYCYELAWNVLKDFYETQGEVNIQGSKDAIRLAFRRGLIVHAETWMQMVRSRILTSHAYNEEMAKEIVSAILNCYYAEFIFLKERLEKLEGGY